MKSLLFTKRLSVLLLLVSPFVSTAQIEAPLIGTFNVIDGSPIETFIISSDKVEAIIDSEVVEKFFFYEKEGYTYTLEKVNPEVTSIDLSITKDRKLISFSYTQLTPENIRLNIIFPNGKEQELTMRKVQ
jgi:hypothetical protein